MGKAKKNSLGIKRQESGIKNDNPFDLKINKRRHEVLGQKIMKWEKGKPGVSKSKWIKTRMEQLLEEHQNRNKGNRLQDKSKIQSSASGNNENVVQKFKMARKNMARLYNLEDDSEDDKEDAIQLTHKGRLLSEIEKFDDFQKDSDDEDGDKEFREKFSEVQFGGPSGKKDISQLIFDSIVEKNKRNKEKRELEILKDDVMKDFHENLPNIKSHLKNPGEDKAKLPVDNLMIKLMTLKNSARSVPSEKLKSEEELALKEKLQLQKLEEERIERMNPRKRVMNHKSADDLDDCFYGQQKQKKRVTFVDEQNCGLERGNDKVHDDDDDENVGEDEEEDDEEEENEDEGDEEEEIELDDEADEDQTESRSSAECMLEQDPFADTLKEIDDPSPNEFDEIFKKLYALSRKNPVECAHKVAEAIYEHHVDFQIELEKNKKEFITYPKNNRLLFLFYMVGNLYSTSDFEHAAVTPTMILMSQMLTQGSIRSPRDVAYGLCICSYWCEYVSLSKRYIAEVMNFLTTVITLHSTNLDKFYLLRVVDRSMLAVSDKGRLVIPSALPMNSIFSKIGSEYLNSDDFRVASLLTAQELSKRFLQYYKDLPSAICIFDSLKTALEGIRTPSYPLCIKERQEDLLNMIISLKHPTQHLIRTECKPVPIPQFVPKFQEKFDGRKKNGGIEKRELVKCKRKEKGIEREIRKEQKLKNRIKFDKMLQEKQAREEKTKRIINDLANQEGEFRALRKKKSETGKKQKVEKF